MKSYQSDTTACIDGRSALKRHYRRKSRHLLVVAMWCFALAAIAAAFISCMMPNPALSPVADVLRPDASVRVVGWTLVGTAYRIGPGDSDVAIARDDDVIVTPEYILWVKLLKIEIKELRRKLQ